MRKQSIVSIAVALVLICGTSISAQSEFKFVAKSDAFTDQDLSRIETAGQVISGGDDRAPVLDWRCATEGLAVLYWFDKEVSNPTVRWRFDATAATPHIKGIDRKYQNGVWGVYLPLETVAAFTSQAKQASRVVFEMKDAEGKTFRDAFSVVGLADELLKLSCARSK